MTQDETQRPTGMMQVAAASDAGKQQTAQPAGATAGGGKRLTLSLRYGTTDSECRWVLMYPIKGKTPTMDTFSITGMSKDDIAKKVALHALEKVILLNLTNIDLYIDQKALRSYVAEAREIIPAMQIAALDDPLGADLDRKAQTVIGGWQRNRREDNLGEAASDAPSTKSMRLLPERSVYVHASVDRKQRMFGIGYVVKDIYTDTETGEDLWNLRFFSSTATSPARGRETMADLRAILRALSGRNIVSKMIKNNTRSLTVISTGKTAVDLLSAMHSNETLGEDILGIWKDPASHILDLIHGVNRVKFEWCEELDNPLSAAAGRMALATRRNEEYGVHGEQRDEIRSHIVDDTIEILRQQGITAIAGEASTDNFELSGVSAPSDETEG